MKSCTPLPFGSFVGASRFAAKSKCRSPWKLIALFCCFGLIAISLPGNTPTPIEQWELRSVFSIGGEAQFSFHSPQEGRAFWISEGQTRHGIEVVRFDRAESTVLIRDQSGRERELSLHRGSIQSSTESEEQEPRLRVPDLTGQNPLSSEERALLNAETSRLAGLWRDESENHAFLREIEESVALLFAEMRENRNLVLSLDEESESSEFAAAEARGRELGEEYENLKANARDRITEIPAFNDQDAAIIFAQFPRVINRINRLRD